MKKWLLVGMLVLLAFPAYAATPYVSIDTRTTWCGSGTVRISGVVDTGNGYNRLHVYFGPQNGTTQNILDRPGLPDGTFIPWEVYVNVTQGQQYYFDARLIKSGFPSVMRVSSQYTVPACATNEVDLVELLGVVQDRLDTIP